MHPQVEAHVAAETIPETPWHLGELILLQAGLSLLHKRGAEMLLKRSITWANARLARDIEASAGRGLGGGQEAAQKSVESLSI